MGSVLVNLSQLENVYSIKFKLILKGERKMYINKINRQMFEDIINALGITYLKIKSIFDEKYFYVIKLSENRIQSYVFSTKNEKLIQICEPTVENIRAFPYSYSSIVMDGFTINMDGSQCWYKELPEMEDYPKDMNLSYAIFTSSGLNSKVFLWLCLDLGLRYKLFDENRRGLRFRFISVDDKVYEVLFDRKTSILLKFKKRKINRL